ncbi:MAG: trigger factor [Candidatus Omnitrophota bacterium]
MKIRMKNIEECRKLFQIEMPKDLVEKATKEVYAQIKKVAKIPGFRPGFAPQDLLEKHYSKDAEGEVLKQLVPEGYREALETHKVIPLGFPKILNVKLEKDKPFTFEAEVDTRPVIKLRNYKGIKVNKKRISTPQSEVTEALERLRSVYAKYNDVERPVKKGDYAVCNVEAYADDKLITKKNQNMWIQAEKEASLLGMGEELVGMTKGQTKEINTKLPENYPDKKYAGKNAKFKILINEVKEKVLPMLDDTFAKELKVEDLDTLKKNIEAQLFARKENNLKIKMENQILEKLLNDHKFSVPTSLVNSQKEDLKKRLQADLMQKGVQKSDAEAKIKEFDSKLEKDAMDKVRIYFLLEEIAEKEKIFANDDDLSAKIKYIALSEGRPEQEIKEYYEKENLLGGLKEEIKEEKTLEFLLKSSEVIEEK